MGLADLVESRTIHLGGNRRRVLLADINEVLSPQAEVVEQTVSQTPEEITISPMAAANDESVKRPRKYRRWSTRDYSEHPRARESRNRREDSAYAQAQADYHRTWRLNRERETAFILAYVAFVCGLQIRTLKRTKGGFIVL